MPDYKNKIGIQGGDYYKPVEYKSIKTNNNEINERSTNNNNGF